MDLSPYFKSIIEQDACAVVICALDHRIIHMNPAAIARYANRGGSALIGKSLMDCHTPHSAALIGKVLAWFAASKDHNRVFTYKNDKENKDVYMVALRDGEGELIGYYEKHEYRDHETAKLYDIN